MDIFLKRNFDLKDDKGQSLMEVVIALAIFSLLAAALASLILGSLSLTDEGGLITRADFLAQEGAEAVKTIKNRAWSELIYSQSAVLNTDYGWQFSGEGTMEEIGGFSRTIRFFPVYRDASGQVIESGAEGALLDTESLLVEVDVSWQSARNTENHVKKNLFLTNWNSIVVN